MDHSTNGLSHDGQCEFGEVLRAVDSRLCFSVGESNKLREVQAQQSLFCFCHRRLMKAEFELPFMDQQLLVQSMIDVVFTLRSKQVSNRLAKTETVERVEKRVQGKVIRVDFKNRRRID